ncbi:MAG: hypothetical protein KAS32_05935 [Candidatus Peribacteraceae bacterium]|nr:hypothetical protein [Candidatus Peribacteraceae bacterium]
MVRLATPRNPITGSEIINRSQFYKPKGSKKGASMRAVIHALRCKDYPICSSDEGYFYPSSVSDIDATIAGLGGRISAMQKAKAGLENGKHNYKVQQLNNPQAK